MNLCNIFQIEYDPDPHGFQPGAQLTGAGETLKMGHFTPGTVVRFNQRRYVILGAPGKPQTLAVRR